MHDRFGCIIFSPPKPMIKSYKVLVHRIKIYRSKLGSKAAQMPSEDIHIKSTVHISNLGEIVDPGSEKKTDAELELNTAENLKEDDTESVGVTSEVADSTKDVNGKEVSSPYSDLVNVGSSFVYTVDRNKLDKNKNITEILASIYKHILTN